MTTLGSHFKGGKLPPAAPSVSAVAATGAIVRHILDLVADSLIASADHGGFEALGGQADIGKHVFAALHQDEAAHDACSLTACLNPLHPGPCKGWKGTLHSVSPGAWKALETARVEKANAARVKKIIALKAQGKPIPKKLLTPIVAKPHPDAGKTAQAATGEAHAAGQAVSDAAGVHVQTPGKVTLGQAVKQIKASDASAEKGPKGKKPTVASKGIAAVIAQEKVTPQYKLDKAAKITPEQWNSLSGDERAIIRGELAKIQTEGFGPQQKKATELLDALPAKGLKGGGTDTVTTPKGQVIQKVSLADVAKPTVEAKPEQEATPSGPSSTAQVSAVVALSNAIPDVKSIPDGASDKLVEAFDKLKSKGDLKEQLPFKKAVTALATAALKVASADKVPGVGHGDNDIHNGTLHKEIADHIAEGKPGLPPMVAKIVAHHEKVQAGEAPKLGDLKPGTPDTITTPKGRTYQKVTLKDTAAEAPKMTPSTGEKPKPTPAHVQNAIDMANGHAPGASWSKNHLAAYEKLTPEEFKSLAPDVQDKIVTELKKGETKFLDPKKVQKTKDLLKSFKAAPTPAAKEAAKDVTLAGNLDDHSVGPNAAKKAVEAAGIGSVWQAVKKTVGLTDDDNPDLAAHETKAFDTALDLEKLITNKYDAKVLADPAAKEAIGEFEKAVSGVLHAQAVLKAKKTAYNKISQALAADKANGGSTLSPMQKAALQHYEKHLLSHPLNTDMDTLQPAAISAKPDLEEKLNAVKKKLDAPAASSMTPAQIESRAKELLGDEAASPNPNLTMAELKAANSKGEAYANGIAGKYPPGIVTDPNVAAKHKNLAIAAGQLEATKASNAKLSAFLDKHHQKAIDSGIDANGNALTAQDKQVIYQHLTQLTSKHEYLKTVGQQQQLKVDDATASFNDAAKKAEATIGHAPVELSSYDTDAIETAYSTAWSKLASKAVVYGLKTYSQKMEMKSHEDYPGLTEDLGKLRTLAGRLALAHAKAHTSKLNIPTNPDTGALLDGPEKKAWLSAAADLSGLEIEQSKLHKAAQAKLDKIRADVGLNKRALPKLDAAAVKSAAAESGYYKTGGYGGPNYGKSAAAKSYMLAKVGPKHAVKHESAAEKKAAKNMATDLANKAKADAAKAQAIAAGKVPATKTTGPAPSVADAGSAPNPTAAEKYGYTYTPQVAPAVGQWSYSSGHAYVASPEALKDLQEHLATPDIKHGLEAQKQFKWSINNMESKGATSTQKGSLYNYTGSGYQSVNTKLNGLPPGAKKTGSTSISNIDAAMAASPPLEGDVVLYRGFSGPQTVFKSGKWNEVNVAGMEWSQRSYSSTSGQLSTAQGFAGYGGVVMRVIIPKGMNVHGINAKGGQHGGENEIILQRGLRYRVVADYGKHDGRRYIDVMVVPSPYDQA